MTDTETTPNSPSPGHPNRCRRSGRGFRVLIVALFASGVGFFAGKAMGLGLPFHGHFGPHSAITRVFAPATAEEAGERAGRMARHLAVEVDATADQQAKLVEIAKNLARDVYPLRQQMKDARDKGLGLLRAPAIDRTAVESLRAEQMAKVETISQRVATALADAADVMTPEQRVKLTHRIEEFRDRIGWWKRWRRD